MKIGHNLLIKLIVFSVFILLAFNSGFSLGGHKEKVSNKKKLESLLKNLDIVKKIKQNAKAKAYAHYILGKIYVNQGQISKAAEEFAAAARLDNTDPSSYFSLVSSLIKLQDYNKAIDVLNESFNFSRIPMAPKPAWTWAIWSFRRPATAPCAWIWLMS